MILGPIFCAYCLIGYTSVNYLTWGPCQVAGWLAGFDPVVAAAGFDPVVSVCRMFFRIFSLTTTSSTAQ